jgi:formylglycine-generating enzyme required for sulfatase activity
MTQKIKAFDDPQPMDKRLIVAAQIMLVFTGCSPKGCVLVKGGALPEDSPLGAVPVDTFYIGKTEVTWGEWKEVRTWALANGYLDLASVQQSVGDKYPVSDVSWYDVVKWCNARSEMESRTAVYRDGADVYRTGAVSEPVVISTANGYRLPSEKEWEFAARGGTKANGYTYSGSNDLNAVGWYRGNSEESVHEVGQKLANELGIFDMSGNLWEWTGSWSPQHKGASRVIRGGFWGVYAGYCAVAYNRNRGANEFHYHSLGFRVALSSVP